jgi:hypothetical protein
LAAKHGLNYQTNRYDKELYADCFLVSLHGKMFSALNVFCLAIGIIAFACWIGQYIVHEASSQFDL